MAIDTSYAQRFSDWIVQQLSDRNTEALLHYRQLMPDAPPSRPSPATNTYCRFSAPWVPLAPKLGHRHVIAAFVIT